METTRKKSGVFIRMLRLVVYSLNKKETGELLTCHRKKIQAGFVAFPPCTRNHFQCGSFYDLFDIYSIVGWDAMRTGIYSGFWGGLLLLLPSRKRETVVETEIQLQSENEMRRRQKEKIEFS